MFHQHSLKLLSPYFIYIYIFSFSERKKTSQLFLNHVMNCHTSNKYFNPKTNGRNTLGSTGSDKDRHLFHKSEFNKPLHNSDVWLAGVWTVDSAKIRAFPETNCPNTDILATCFPAHRNVVVRRLPCKMEHGRSPDCLDRWVEVFSPFSLSGPFALINARWPDETWEQLRTPHLVRQALPDWLEEDPFWNLSWFDIFFCLGQGAICCKDLFRGLERALTLAEFIYSKTFAPFFYPFCYVLWSR